MSFVNSSIVETGLAIQNDLGFYFFFFDSLGRESTISISLKTLSRGEEVIKELSIGFQQSMQV